jgi:hypothetical protein
MENFWWLDLNRMGAVTVYIVQSLTNLPAKLIKSGLSLTLDHAGKSNPVGVVGKLDQVTSCRQLFSVRALKPLIEN